MTKTELDTKPDTNTNADNGVEPVIMPEIPGVKWLTDDEAHAMFDAKARKVMGMSGEEFLRRYDAGEFDDMPDDSEEHHLHYWSLVMSIPFGRQIRCRGR